MNIKTARQTGFSFLELLVASLFGSLVLLAASQGMASLLKHQNQLSQLQRFSENIALTEASLLNTLNKAQGLTAYGAASKDFPALTMQTQNVAVIGAVTTSFQNFASSDWLALAYSPQDVRILHVDKKTNSFGLAYKRLDLSKLNNLTSSIELDAVSQTLVNDVEMLRLRTYATSSQAWVSAANLLPDLSPENPVNLTQQPQYMQLVALVASSEKLTRISQPDLYLWGEKLSLPDDGKLRQLVSVTGQLQNPANTPEN